MFLLHSVVRHVGETRMSFYCDNSDRYYSVAYETAVERHYERMFDDFYADRKTVEPDDPCFDLWYEENADDD